VHDDVLFLVKAKTIIIIKIMIKNIIIIVIAIMPNNSILKYSKNAKII